MWGRHQPCPPVYRRPARGGCGYRWTVQSAPSQARLHTMHPRSSGLCCSDRTRASGAALVGGGGLPGLGACGAGWCRGRTVGWGECRAGCGGSVTRSPLGSRYDPRIASRSLSSSCLPHAPPRSASSRPGWLRLSLNAQAYAWCPQRSRERRTLACVVIVGVGPGPGLVTANTSARRA